MRWKHLWLVSPDHAVLRVRQRVEEGGHDVPEETIRRRYVAGLRNFFGIYRPIAHGWTVYNASKEPIELIAEKSLSGPESIVDTATWNLMNAIGKK